MSCPTMKELDDRKKALKNIPILRLEITVQDPLFQKYDIVKIGGQQFMIMNHPLAFGTKYVYSITAISEEEIFNSVDFLTTALPEL